MTVPSPISSIINIVVPPLTFYTRLQRSKFQVSNLAIQFACSASHHESNSEPEPNFHPQFVVCSLCMLGDREVLLYFAGVPIQEWHKLFQSNQHSNTFKKQPRIKHVSEFYFQPQCKMYTQLLLQLSSVHGANRW